MPYTYLSLALVWLIIAALVAVTASGLVAGPWRLLLVLAALATSFLLRSPAAAGTGKRGRSRGLMSRLGRRPHDLSGSDISRWENEGGARRHAGGQLSEPAPAVR